MSPVHSATLRCGVILTYEVETFLPQAGEKVPCRTHGYCDVAHVTAPSRRSPSTLRSRARPRTTGELVDWIALRPCTTVSALRRERFTLRLVQALAERGDLAVDYVTGRVELVDPPRPAATSCA